MAPDSGSSKPSSNLNRDDLPLPDGPTIATYSPAAMRNSMLSRTGAPPGTYRKLTPQSSSEPESRPGDFRSPDTSVSTFVRGLTRERSGTATSDALSPTANVPTYAIV